MRRADRERLGLPPRLFLYTLDQIADMLAVSDLAEAGMVHFEGRSPGVPQERQMIARNISPDDQPPEWRVEEREFIRWMKHTNTIPVDRFIR